jgi:hypothetical protein
MDGLNKLFMSDPKRFLETYPLRVRGRLDPTSPLKALQPGQSKYQFDIQRGFRLDSKSRKIRSHVELHPFEPHSTCFGTPSPITGYWLDYEPTKSHFVDLMHEDVYFLFTPTLDGCYIGVANSRIVHVGGRVQDRSSAEEIKARIAARGSRNRPTQAESNAFHRKKMLGYAQEMLGADPVVGFDSNKPDFDPNAPAADEHAESKIPEEFLDTKVPEEYTFVGVRRGAEWIWYVQGHESFVGITSEGATMGIGALQPRFPGARSVIQLKDMTYG